MVLIHIYRHLYDNQIYSAQHAACAEAKAAQMLRPGASAVALHSDRPANDADSTASLLLLQCETAQYQRASALGHAAARRLGFDTIGRHLESVSATNDYKVSTNDAAKVAVSKAQSIQPVVAMSQSAVATAVARYLLQRASHIPMNVRHGSVPA